MLSPSFFVMGCCGDKLWYQFDLSLKMGLTICRWSWSHWDGIIIVGDWNHNDKVNVMKIFIGAMNAKILRICWENYEVSDISSIALGCRLIKEELLKKSYLPSVTLKISMLYNSIA